MLLFIKIRWRLADSSSPAQLPQVFVAGLDALEWAAGFVVLDDVMFDPRLVGLREDALPVDDAASDLRHVLMECVAEILAARLRNLRKLLHIIDVHEREPYGITTEILERVGASDGDPAQVEFHLDQVGIARLEQKIVGQLSVDGQKLEPVVVIRELDAG